MTVFVWESDGKSLFPKLNFTSFIYFKIPSRRLYSPSLKTVGWIEDAQLIFLIFHTFVCNFFSRAAPFYPAKFTDKCMKN